MLRRLSKLFATFFLLPSILVAQDLTINEIDGQAYADEAERITFMAHVSSSSEAELSYSWTFGDGRNPVSGKAKSTVSHAYRDQGDFQVSLTVRSADGQSASMTKDISIKNVDPKIKPVKMPGEARISEPLRLQVIGIDPGDDDLTYTWEFSDDGEKMEGEDLSRVTKQFSEIGVHEIKLTVKDEDGGSVTENYMVSVGVEYSMSVSGSVSASNSGGAYFTYLSATPEGGDMVCGVGITLFNDNDRSIVQMFWRGGSQFFGEDSNPPMATTFWWRMPDAAYFQFKSFGQQTNAMSDPDFLNDYMAGLKRAPASIIKMGVEAGSEAFSNMGRKLKSLVDRLPFGKKKKEPTKPDPSMSGAMDFKTPNGFVRAKRPVGGRLQGSFSFSGADFEGNVASVAGKFNMDVTPLHQSFIENGCEDKVEEFAVVDVTPRDEAKNVKHKDTEVVVEFSQPVNRETVDESSIVISYIDAEGDEIFVPANYEYRDDKTVVLHPDVDSLKTGVIYMGNIHGGEYGIRGGEDEMLEESYSWIFSTIVVPDSTRLDLYQVSRNAPLVTNKPTAARLYAFWTGDEEVHPDHHVTEFIADVELPPYNATQEIFTRQDQFTDNEKRYGGDSVNLYNWRPSGRGLKSFEATIIPIQQEEGEEIKFKAKREMEYFSIDGEILDVEYYMLRVGYWALVIPDETRAAAKLVANRSSLYTQQQFPIARNRVRNGGEINLFGENADAEWVELWKFLRDSADLVKGLPAGYRRDLQRDSRAYFFLALLHAFMSQVNSDADILLGFMPDSYIGGGSANFNDPLKVTEPLEPGKPDFHRRTAAMTPVSYAYLTNALTHEYGHLFSLDHVPYAANANDRANKCAAIGSKKTWTGIEGMRMSKSGRYGWPKSSRFGNSESSSYLLPLMFPCARLMEESFIQESQYKKLQDHMKASRAAGNWTWINEKSELDQIEYGPNPSHGSGSPRQGIDGTQTMSLSGLIAEGNISIFPPTLKSAGLDVQILKASNQIELLNKDSEILYRADFESNEIDESGSRSFAVDIPWSSDVAAIRYSGLGLKRAWTKEIGPTISSDLTVSCSKQNCDLSWTTDYQGEETPIYSVFYRADESASWRMLAAFWPDQSIKIEMHRLSHGDNPEFRVDTFVDGNTSTTSKDIELDFGPMEVIFTWPLAGDTLDVRSEISVGLNNQPDGGSLNLENIILEHSSGSKVDVYIFNEGDDQEFIVRPKEALDHDQEYTLRVKKEVVSKLDIGLKEDFILNFKTAGHK